MDMLAITILLLQQATTSSANWVKGMENPHVFQGDILLDLDEVEFGKNFQTTYASIKGARWPKGKVPYIIDSTIGEAGVVAIKEAISQYHQHTCLRFHQQTNEATYVLFTKGNAGCLSPIGYREGRVNVITLGEQCWKSCTVMHEIGHTIGFYHEQSRPDRDQYVNILYDNIIPERWGEFDYKSDVDSLGTPYDYQSLMHYGPFAFSKNGEMTIETRDPAMQNEIGQQQGFSEIDKLQIRLMYEDLCNGGDVKCTDEMQGCGFWASKGLCGPGNLHNWMNDNCCDSCKGSSFEGTSLLGCFSQHIFPLSSSTLLFSERKNIVWEPAGFQLFVQNLLRRCRDESRASGYTYFSIRFYGECYAGNQTTSMLKSGDLSGFSTNCVTGDGKYNTCRKKLHVCVGGAGADFVYMLKN